MLNLFTTHLITIKIYIKTHLRKPKIRIQKSYFVLDKVFLLSFRDIEANPGAMLDILYNHPTSHRRRNKTYFISNTIKLKPKYQHLAKIFAPF